MVSSLVSINFDSPQLGKQRKKYIYKTLEYWFRDILNFDFLKIDLAIVSPPYFVYDSSRKMFLKLYSINWPNFITWLPLLLEILFEMCIAIIF